MVRVSSSLLLNVYSTFSKWRSSINGIDELNAWKAEANESSAFGKTKQRHFHNNEHPGDSEGDLVYILAPGLQASCRRWDEGQAANVFAQIICDMTASTPDCWYVTTLMSLEGKDASQERLFARGWMAFAPLTFDWFTSIWMKNTVNNVPTLVHVAVQDAAWTFQLGLFCLPSYTYCHIFKCSSCGFNARYSKPHDWFHTYICNGIEKGRHLWG